MPSKSKPKKPSASVVSDSPSSWQDPWLKALALPAPASVYDPGLFEYPWQVGGIETGSLDHPQPMGGQSSRIARLDTGAGLRMTIALDRGGDIVSADHRGTNLAYLTPNGYKPANPAYHQAEEWLTGWPGGLLTGCGPEYMGGPRVEDGKTTSLHGRHSNTPAAVISVTQPEPRLGRLGMGLEMVVRDSRFYGPTFELRRQIVATLGVPGFILVDRITNLSDQPLAHNWLYHINLGYPLLEPGARFVYRGPAAIWQPKKIAGNRRLLNALKKARPPQADRTGSTSDAILVEPDRPDEAGLNHVGLINPARKLGLMISYPLKELPRLCNWQHFGPAGAYVSGIEPYRGSLVGLEEDDHPRARQRLEPGEMRSYHLRFLILEGKAVKNLEAFDGPLLPMP